jgi:hypothetical protein
MCKLISQGWRGGRPAGTHSCPGICYSQKMGMTANYNSFKHSISVLAFFSLLATGTATSAQQAPTQLATPPPTSPLISLPLASSAAREVNQV